MSPTNAPAKQKRHKTVDDRKRFAHNNIQDAKQSCFEIANQRPRVFQRTSPPMRHLLPPLLLCALWITGCTDPDLTVPDENFEGAQCETNADCGSDGNGWLCDAENSVCEQGYINQNGVFEDRIVLGMSAAITTGPTELGAGMRDGIKAYFTHVNKTRGGVCGRQLELLEKDDGYNPDTALSNVKEMVDGDDRQVFAIIGNVGTPTAAVTLPYVANEKDVIFFGAFTGAGLLREDPPNRYVFNYRASYEQETEAAVQYLTQAGDPAIPATNVGVFAQGEDDNGTMDAYGQAGFDGVYKALRTKREDLVEDDVFYVTYKRNTSNTESAVAGALAWLTSEEREVTDGKIKAALVLVPTTNPASSFIRGIQDAIKNRGTGFELTDAQKERLDMVEVTYSSVSFVGSDTLARSLQEAESTPGEYCSPVIITEVVPDPDSSATGVSAYRDQLAAYDSNLSPGFVSLEGYLVARLFVEGLEQHGCDIDTESFVNTLENLKGIDWGIGSELEFGRSNHQASNKVWGTTMTRECTLEPLDF